jgi:hypothetical protein
MEIDTSLLVRLEERVSTLLLAEDDGISEYALLKKLAQNSTQDNPTEINANQKTIKDDPVHQDRPHDSHQNYDDTINRVFNNSQQSNLDLFQAHFALFHVLYRLKLRYHTAQSHQLEIGPLCIKLHPWTPTHSTTLNSLSPTRVNEQAVAEADPLASYYLNLENLFDTDADDIENLLNRFFRGLLGPDYRTDALATLGLSDPVDNKTIKKRYRELAMRHHPDRGGDTETLQAINQAFTQLMS